MLTAKSILPSWIGPSLASLLALALGCGPARVEKGPPFDVLIYVLDACRADRIGAYGYPRPTTPEIDAVASDPDAVTYSRLYVAGNWTKPATASLFTSKYVHQHQVTNLHSKVEDRRYKAEVLGDELLTMAESFRDAGFATMGLVTSLHLPPKYGFAQGFDTYFDPENLKVGDVGRVSKLLELIHGLDEASYFAYVHQNACHLPFKEADRDPEIMAEFGFAYDEASRKTAAIDFTTADITLPIRNGDLQLTAEDTRFLSLVYDAKLRKVDRDVVGPLVEGLRQAGRWDRTLLILTADHGEQLYEHRGYGHARDLWEEVIHVPLIVKFPKGMRPPSLGTRSDTLASNVDLFPSLLEFLGRPIPKGLSGRSIFDSPKGGVILSQAGAKVWAVLNGREKLIMETGDRNFLFDLEADPKEAHDLAESQPERVAALTALAEAVRARTEVTEALEIETQLSPEAIETLRSLGYLD